MTRTALGFLEVATLAALAFVATSILHHIL